MEILIACILIVAYMVIGLIQLICVLFWPVVAVSLIIYLLTRKRD